MRFKHTMITACKQRPQAKNFTLKPALMFDVSWLTCPENNKLRLKADNFYFYTKMLWKGLFEY